MIHVCRVDIGSRHVFDSADGINDIGSLVTAIEHHFRIDKSKQILLISGGEVLDDYQQKLYRLSAGREESPIYLIDKINVEKDHPPNIEMPLDNLSQDMKQEIQAAITMKPSFHTLQLRSQLAFRVNELGKNLHKLCQSFYDDQYWQYQGFLALIANLDDFVNSFKKRQEVIKEQFEKYLSNSSSYKELMKDIDKYIEILSNVRLSPKLMIANNSSNETTGSNENLNRQKEAIAGGIFNSFSSQSIANLQSIQNLQIPSTGFRPQQPQKLTDESNTNENKTTVTNENIQNLTLLDWIKSTDPHNKLHSVIEETRDILNNFDSNFKWLELQTKINKILSQIDNNPQMREIEGLTKRLQDLNNFLDMSNKLLKSQNEIAEGFNANLERATLLRDDSILEDLCNAHERQLEIFRGNHSKMIEITSKISKAKLELIRVIHSRLHWVMHVQNQLADFDFQLQIYFKQLRRLNVRLKLMEQLKKAPYVYLYSLKESVRRINFSKTYKLFAKTLLGLINKVYGNEMQRRELFDKKTSSIAQHFILSILFRSLSDRIEPLMNESNLNFDNQLPNVDESEVLSIENDLKTHLSKYINNISSNLQKNIVFNSGSSSSTSSSSSSAQFEPSSPLSPTPLTSSVKQQTKIIDENSSSKKYTDFINSNENLLRELNVDEQMSLKDDPDLNLLNKLVNYLNNTEEGQIEETGQDNKIEKHVETKINTESFNKDLFDSTLSDVKLKLDKTKQELNLYKTELNENIKTISQTYVQLNKLLNDQLEKAQSNKENFYKNLYNKVESLFSKHNPTNENDNSDDVADDLDKQFMNKIIELIKSKQGDHKKQVDELKTAMNSIKTSISAEKQIQFNEAIKRATVEKDKIIEDLKNKENIYIERINNLNKALNDTTTSLATLSSLGANSKQILPQDSSSSLNPVSNYEDVNETKAKLRELMLQEKIRQLEKQLAMFTTLPVTNFYETIQLNSCNIDDLVIAVYCEEYSAYKIIHKTSSYLHFVHSALFKSREHRLSYKSSSSNNSSNNITNNSKTVPSTQGEYSSSPICKSHLEDLPVAESATFSNNDTVIIPSSPPPIHKEQASSSKAELASSPVDSNLDSNNMFYEKQPWFVGKVIVKEFCIARRENNRFRVPSGTRFYRVKLKPYNLHQ